MLTAMHLDARLTGILAAGIGIGIILFFKGFLAYREFRVEEDTPEVPIRSVALGLVHIHGQAKAGERGAISSPVGRTPCLSYKVDIERWESSGNRGHWSHWKTAWGGVPFVLDDTTGQVAINAHGAEFMTGQNAQTVAGAWAGGSYVSLDNDPYAPPDPYALRDPYAPQGSANTGTAASVSAAATQSAATAVVGPPSDAELVQFAESAPGGRWGHGTGDYRLTEYVIFDGWSYDIVGTYQDNPESIEELDREAAAKDPSYKPPPAPAPGAASDRKMVAKGTNEKTFVISSEDERGTIANLKQRATMQIFGGAALSVACLALLLNQLGML